jgi:hypothetical protein
MGAPFVIFRADIATPAQVPQARWGEKLILGEFGHAAKGLADALLTGLTLHFPNSGSAIQAALAGKKSAFVNW